MFHRREEILWFNTTFNTITVKSWWPFLLMSESRESRENHRPATSHGLALSQNVVSSVPAMEEYQTLMVICIYSIDL